MPAPLRIGARIGSADPYWVQMREAVLQHSQHLGIALHPIDTSSTAPLDEDEQTALVEDVLAQHLDALICSYLPEQVTLRLLEHGLPVIQLTETSIHHPLLIAPRGYYEIAQMVGRYLAQQLHGCGSVLIVGGLLAHQGEDGRSRIAGITDALHAFPAIALQHIPSAWRYEHAYPQIEAAMRQHQAPIDAIFGLSDSLALAARDAGRALGLIDAHTIIVGINGDPLALAAIADGSMSATVDTPAAALGTEAVNLACQAARRAPLPPYFGYAPRLVTAHNVADVAMQKLIAIAELPSRLVGVNRQQEQQRLAHLELRAEINQRIGSILDRQQIGHEIAELIRTGYGYDAVHVYDWVEHEQMLVLGEPDQAGIPVAEGGLLGEALRRNNLIFVPDTQHSDRFPPDLRCPATRSRVVVPIRFGETILGLLDLHSRSAVQHTRHALDGLQLLADELGIAMRNADLYNAALRSLAIAEQADQLKTRLLANVSHELRTPLNVILGYSEAALGTPNPYNTSLPAALLHDLRHIYRSGEHLLRLINDLLDLSRAEIDALELFPQAIPLHAFLTDVFESVAHGLDDGGPRVAYRLALPEHLPVLEADPVRLRQVLLNLLSNARAWTAAGQITLGAEVLPQQLHIWVEDTGVGIPPDLHERIFEPFRTGAQDQRRPGGVGLGLSIARRLVALHHGTLTVESRPGCGSTFHISFPLRTDPRSCATMIMSKPLHSTTLRNVLASLQPEQHAGPVLIVDDDAPARDLYCRLVADALPEYVVECADDGRAALGLLERVVPSLVLLDLTMPGVDGFAVLHHLRADARTCRVPVVVVSGRTLAIDDVELLDHGSVTFHTKDLLSHAEVAATVQTALLGDAVLAQPTSRIVKHAIAYIHQHHMRDLSRQEIAQTVGVSKNYLTHIFHQELGISPWDYLNRYRIMQAKALLRDTGDSVTTIAGRVGFDDVSYFGRMFRKQVGCSPHTYRQQG